jgi:NAD(P)-dependent dehydrogenase (short-subunit alcohol dehydrogenase family)
LVRQLAERKDAPVVFATARKPKEAHELNALAAKLPNVHVVEADLVKKLDSAAAEVKKHVDGVDVLIVNGAEFVFGMFSRVANQSSNNHPAYRFFHQFHTNATSNNSTPQAKSRMTILTNLSWIPSI